MPDIEVIQLCSITNILLRYNWHLDPIDKKTIVDLGLQSVKKYQRCAIQIANKFSYFKNFFLYLLYL